jgi:hypothetical protein
MSCHCAYAALHVYGRGQLWVNGYIERELRIACTSAISRVVENQFHSPTNEIVELTVAQRCRTVDIVEAAMSHDRFVEHLDMRHKLLDHSVSQEWNNISHAPIQRVVHPIIML